MGRMPYGDWGDTATSQEASGAARSQKGWRRTLPYEGAWLCPYLDFGLRTETLNCCGSEPPTLWYLERAAPGNNPPWIPAVRWEVRGEDPRTCLLRGARRLDTMPGALGDPALLWGRRGERARV